MRKALNQVIGGRPVEGIRWLSLSNLDYADVQHSIAFGAASGGDARRLSKLDADALAELTGLLSLDLSGHAIVDLEHMHGPNIEELFAARNRLRRLEGIGRLTRLRVLDVSRNVLEHLPPQIGLLKQLRWLDVSFNRLAILSDLSYLEGCTSLFRLSLGGNPLSNVRSLTEVVLQHCRSLVQLDDEDVSIISKARRGVAPPGGVQVGKANGKGNAKAQEELAAERAARLAAAGEADDLRSQLEAVSQLLVRKTKEWAVAEEQASALKQQVAFLKIDMSGSGSSSNKDGSASPDLAKPVTAFTSSDTDDQDATATSMSKDEAYRGIEREISDNAARTLQRLKVLTDDQREANARTEVLQGERENAVASFNRTKQELNATEEYFRSQQSKTSEENSGGGTSSNLQALNRTAVFLAEKERERGELIALVRKLRLARHALKRKMVCTQDLMVIRVNANNLEEEDEDRRDKAGTEEFECRARNKLQAKLDQLESEHERACIDVVSVLTDVSATASGSSRVRELFPSLTLLLSALDEDHVAIAAAVPAGLGESESFTHGSGSGSVHASAMIFDASITRLSAQAMNTKEHDQAAKECLDGCLARIAQVERSALLLRENSAVQNAEEADRALAKTAVGRERLEVLRVASVTESEAVRRLESEVAAGRVRQREIQVSILKVKSDAWRIEAQLRARQNALLARTLRAREAALYACSRTIERRTLGGAIELSGSDNQCEHINDQQLLQTSLNDTQQPENASTDDDSTANNNLNNSFAVSMISEQHRTTPSAVLSDHSEQKARASRRQVFEQLVVSEASFATDLSSLVDGLLLPMRRRCLLPPRDLQVICSNFSELLFLHQSLLSSFQQAAGHQNQGVNQQKSAPDGARIVSVLHKRLEKLQVTYTAFAREAPDAVALLEVRRRQHATLDALLRAGSETYGRDMHEFMLMPAARLQQYSNCVARLLQLQPADGSASQPTAWRLKELSCALTELLFRADRAAVVTRARALGNLRSLLPARKGLLSTRDMDWLSAQLLNDELGFRGKATCGETLLLRPNVKATTLPRAECVVFASFVALAAYPQRWHAAFESQRPRLGAVCVLRADRGLDASAPFANSVEGRNGYGLRLFTAKGEEAVLCFEHREDVDKVYEQVKAIVLERLQAPEQGQALDGGHVVLGGTRGEENNSPSPSPNQSQGSSNQAADELSSASKYPGTDMTKRREVAQRLKRTRGVWMPPELENIEAQQARERIKSRDGWSLRDVYTHAPGANDGFALRETSIKERKQVSKALDRTCSMSSTSKRQHQKQPMVTPIKLRGGGPQKQQLKRPIGFGSTISAERNDIQTNPKPRQKLQQRRGIGRHLDEVHSEAEVAFDSDSVHYYSNQGRPSSPKADLSIFKASRTKIPLTPELNNLQSRRFIGLNADCSEKIKEANRNELRYYQGLEK